METKENKGGLSLAVSIDPKSNFEEWAAEGLGDPKSIVDAFVDMFSSMLQGKELIIFPHDLHRWLDVYYTLRAAAEQHAARMKTLKAFLNSSDGLGFKAVEDEFPVDEDLKKVVADALEEATKALRRVNLTQYAEARCEPDSEELQELRAVGKKYTDVVDKLFMAEI